MNYPKYYHLEKQFEGASGGEVKNVPLHQGYDGWLDGKKKYTSEFKWVTKQSAEKFWTPKKTYVADTRLDLTAAGYPCVGYNPGKHGVNYYVYFGQVDDECALIYQGVKTPNADGYIIAG